MSVPEPKAAFGRVPCQVAKVPFSEVATQSHYLSNLRTDSIKAFLPRVYVERSEI
jgi:hypothetical protein